MKKRIGFFVLAAIIAVVGFFSMDTSKETEAISKAVYVTDGKVLPENEGKLLVVAGEFEIVNPIVDKITGVELPGVIARRTVDRYEKVSKTEDGKTYYTLEWKPTTLGKDNEFGDAVSSNLVADCKVGDIVIDNTVTHCAFPITEAPSVPSSCSPRSPAGLAGQTIPAAWSSKPTPLVIR